MLASVRFVLCTALLSLAPVYGALVLTLDQPVQMALPGDVLAFTGTIVNTGPEAASLGIDERFLPMPSFPFTIALPLGLAGFRPGPGDSYAGTIFAVFVSPAAQLGDSFAAVAQITASLPTGGTLVSNGVPFEVTVGVPEPGSAMLLAVPVLLACARRWRVRRASCR